MSVRTALSDNRPSWHNPRILILLLSIFLCGAAAGALALRLASPAPVSSGGAWSAGGREWTLQMMRAELNLTPGQAAEIEYPSGETIWWGCGPGVDTVRDATENREAG